MSVDRNQLEILSYGEAGYQPIIDYGSWRVAVLRYCDELLPQNLDAMQRHDETDEVFILLAGHCILFIGDGDETVETITGVEMEPLNYYNVKRGAWHTHSLDRDATVLIVENRDTSDANSPRIALTPAQRAHILELGKGYSV